MNGSRKIAGVVLNQQIMQTMERILLDVFNGNISDAVEGIEKLNSDEKFELYNLSLTKDKSITNMVVKLICNQ